MSNIICVPEESPQCQLEAYIDCKLKPYKDVINFLLTVCEEYHKILNRLQPGRVDIILPDVSAYKQKVIR